MLRVQSKVLNEMFYLRPLYILPRLKTKNFYVKNTGLASTSVYSTHMNYSPLVIKKYKTFSEKFDHNLNTGSSLFYTSEITSVKRYLHLSSNICSKEPSKVEETVKVLKEEIKAKEKDENLVQHTLSTSSAPLIKEAHKRSLGKRILDELIHYYHGFRLLFIDIRISSRLIFKILRGTELTRRENKQLVRTVSDLFRLVPFSIFIIVPFMELLLPVFIKLFPAMLPSTFESASDKEKKIKAKLKIKIEMAKFLQDTLDNIALSSKGDPHSETAKEFAMFFKKIRTSGEQATNEEILKFSKLFEDEITLDNLSRPSLIALCRLLELQPIGTNNFLRFQLKMKLRALKADDKMIMKEGLETLNVPELQQACRSRGIRALGVSEERLRLHLKQWLELSLNEEIPPSLLLLSRVLYLPENLPAPDQLKATLSILPDTAATEAKFKIGEVEGKTDNRTKLEIIKLEEAAIKKEAEELVEEMLDEQKEAEIDSLAKHTLTDKAPSLEDKAEILVDQTDEKAEVKEPFSKKDFDDLEDALENIANEKKILLIEKEEIEDLKEDFSEYKQDIEELKDIALETGHKELKESKAAVRLSNKVNKIILKMDTLLDELTKEQENLQQKIDDKVKEGISILKERDDIIGINELVLAIRRIQKVPDDTRLQRIADVLEKMDIDRDGAVEVDHVLKVIELLGKDNVKVTSKQMEEIIELLLKEDVLELEEKIQKQQMEDTSQGKTEGQHNK